MQKRRPTGILVAAVIIWTACTPPADTIVPPPVPASPSPRLVSGRLPVTLAGNIPLPDSRDSNAFGGTFDRGPDVGLSLFSNDGIPHQISGSLVAVAALPDRLVVVFPTATQVGYDVAVGGLDLPWSSRHLFDIPREHVGAIDAVANNDRGVFVAMRERLPSAVDPLGPPPVHFYELDENGILLSEELIPGAGRPVPWWQDRCPDVQIGVSLAGDVDVITIGPTHARRLAGSTFWDLQNLDLTPVTNFDVVVDTGCRNRIAYDESDLPQVLSLQRVFPRRPADKALPPLSPTELANDNFSQDASQIPVTSALGFFMGGDGRWRRPGPFASLKEPHTWHEGGLDVEAHPDGFLLSGPKISMRSPNVSFERSSFVQEPDTSAFDGDAFVGNFFGTPDEGMELENEGNTDKIMFNECGALRMMKSSSLGFLGPRVNYDSTLPGLQVCRQQTLAPVFVVPRPEQEAMRAAVYAHGRRQYDVGICLTGAASLTVCAGGWQQVTVPPPPDDEAPILVDSAPQDGAVDVDPGTGVVVMHFDRPLRADERVVAQVSQVSRGFDPSAQPAPVTVAGETITITLPAPLDGPVGGVHWRVALDVFRGDQPFTFIGQRRPVVDFRIPDGRRHEDRRFVAPERPCRTDRVDGVCDIGSAPFARETRLVLGVDYDIATNNVGGVRVTNPEGVQQNVGVTTDPFFARNALILTFRTALEPSTRYLITIPAAARDSYGAPFRPDELAYAFTTEPTP